MEGGNDGWTELHWACWDGNLAEIKHLLATGADIHAKLSSSGKTPLHMAASSGDAACITALLEAGADPFAVCNPPEGFDKANKFRLISDRKTEAEHDGFYQLSTSLEDVPSDLRPLDLAAVNGSAESVRLLNKAMKTANPSPEQIKPPPYTILRHCVINDWDETMHALIEGGMSIDTVDPSGCGPLHWALVGDSVFMIRELLAAGADPYRRYNAGQDFHQYVRALYLNDPDMMNTVLQILALECKEG